MQGLYHSEKTMEISISENKINDIKTWFVNLPWYNIVLFLAVFLSTVAIGVSLMNGWIIAYGDAQSHLNIPKRIVDSITPGLAQLGGIWLPLPHLLMLPFVKIEILYRTGLAGSIVSGAAFVISCLYIYRLVWFITKSKITAFVAFLVFALNPNMLYLQTTALTEPVLILFFILSSYYFTRFIAITLKNKKLVDTEERARHKEFLYLVFAAFFAFCASLSRYDGWFLVLIESVLVIFVYLPINKYIKALKEKKFKAPFILIREKFYIGRGTFNKIQGMFVLFSVLAFVGILMWFVWDGLILGDPFYFTDSNYSAKAQQQAWLKRNELPAVHNLPVSFDYYFFDSMTNVGVVIFAVSLVGLIVYISKNNKLFAYVFALILVVPFIFNVFTMYMGQSVIFIPHITPSNFEWKIFNVRYGILMLPAAAVFYALLFHYLKNQGKLILIIFFLLQIGLYGIGYSKVMALSDGTEGLSASKNTDADLFMKKHYDNGLVLMDDFARSVNIIQSNIPMQNIIYIGNKPYWPVSMKEPERYAKWIVIQKNDEVWQNIYEKPDVRGRLYKYFNKVYTSPDILIFERMNA